MRNLAISLIILTLATATLAAENTGTASGAFLNLGLGARPMAMGNAFVALADDCNSLFWNPAGLANVKKPELLSMYTSWFQDTKYGAFTLALPGLGASAAYLDYGPISETTLANPGGTGATINSGALVYNFGLGRNYNEKIAWGVGFKMFGEYIGGSDMSGYAFDLGGLVRIPERNLTLGLAATNLLGSLQGKLSQTITAGLAYKILNLTSAGDLSFTNDNGVKYKVGCEWDVNKMFYPRLGLDTGKICFGFGLLMSRVNFDYAYLATGDLAFP
jgi:hypothetical protein